MLALPKAWTFKTYLFLCFFSSKTILPLWLVYRSGSICQTRTLEKGYRERLAKKWPIQMTFLIIRSAIFSKTTIISRLVASIGKCLNMQKIAKDGTYEYIIRLLIIFLLFLTSFLPLLLVSFFFIYIFLFFKLFRSVSQ